MSVNAFMAAAVVPCKYAGEKKNDQARKALDKIT